MANRLSYYAYGLCIGSDIPLPVSWQSSACRGNAQPDIEIYLGVVPAAPDDLKAASDLCRFDARRCWLHVPHVAHFWSEDGTRICVQPAEGADETTIAAFLVTSLIPTALAQQNKVIMPDKIGGDHMASLVVMPDLITFMDQLSIEGESTTNLEEVEIADFKDQVDCQSIRDLNLRSRTGCTIIGYIKPDGRYIINPEPDLELEPKGKVIVLGRPEQIQRLNQMFHIHQLKTDEI